MTDLIKRLSASCYLAFEDGTNDYSAAQEAIDLIEELIGERDDYKDLYYAGFKDAASLNIHYAEIGYKAKTAEAKFVKAVEALQEIADYTYFSLEHGVTQNAEARIARKVLAELEKS